jgi:hypothetical protein
MMAFRTFVPVAVLAAAISACTTAQEIRRVDGRAEYLVACSASLGWGHCYDRANEVCPAGYETLAEMPGFNRKELRVACTESTGGATRTVTAR